MFFERMSPVISTYGIFDSLMDVDNDDCQCGCYHMPRPRRMLVGRRQPPTMNRFFNDGAQWLPIRDILSMSCPYDEDEQDSSSSDSETDDNQTKLEKCDREKTELTSENTEIQLDLSDFKPEDIRVEIRDGKLLVQARREERTGNSLSYRQTSRIVPIPENIDPKKLTPILNSDGVLVLTEASVSKVTDVEKRHEITTSPHEGGEMTITKTVHNEHTKSKTNDNAEIVTRDIDATETMKIDKDGAVVKNINENTECTKTNDTTETMKIDEDETIASTPDDTLESNGMNGDCIEFENDDTEASSNTETSITIAPPSYEAIREADQNSLESTHSSSTYIPDVDLDSKMAGHNQMKIEINLSEFKPEDIHVQTKNNGKSLEINAKSEQKSENSYSFREFRRVFVIPDNVDPRMLKSELSPEGVLVIQAPVNAAIEGQTPAQNLAVTHED